MKQKIRYDKNNKATGYLFINRYILPKYLEAKTEREAEEIRQLTSRNIQQIYRELNEKAGRSSSYGKRKLIRSHNLRKFFNSMLLAKGADIFTTDFMMGHKIDPTKDAYFRADPNSLKEKYKNFIPYLTIQKELNISESPEYQKIKNENQILQAETARHVVERSELQDLRKELDNMKKREAESSDLLFEIMDLVKQNPEIEKTILKKE